MSRYIMIKEEDPGTPDALRLMEELSDTLQSITGSSGKSSFHPEEVRGPGAVFVIARDQDGKAVGCGAIRPMDDTAAEVKRVYAKEKGLGVGTKVISYLESKARELGYSVIRLETRKINEGAVTFYENRGYDQIPNYGNYVNRPEAVCFEKRLAD